MGKFLLKIVTPDGPVFDGEAEGILARTDTGDVEIMRGHADFFAPLGIGRATLTVDGKKRSASSAGGFISVRGGEVLMIATTFEFADEIDLERARLAKECAEERIKNATNKRDIDLARAKLMRALNRINVAELK